MSEPLQIPKRVSQAIITALTHGTTPRIGLEYITIGRKREVDVLLRDLEVTKEGGSAFKIILGKYGSGKSFLLQAIRNYAMDKGFVVMDADLSSERRFIGANGRGLATYRELVKNMATKTSPNGGALNKILQKWIDSIKAEVSKKFAGNSSEYSDMLMRKEVSRKIASAISNMAMVVHEFDFAHVMDAYWRGYESNEELMQNAMKWFRGEYVNKREAKLNLGVNVIIDDAEWYEYIKLWAEFVTGIGYSGLVLFLDEAKTLGNIPSSVSRNANYEKLLTIFNECTQGRVSNLAILMSGTDEFIKDPKRGLFSYDALRSRIDDGRYGEIRGRRNYDAPLMPLQVLSHEEIFYLLQKLREIHGIHYNYQPRITDENLRELIEATIRKVGSTTHLTPRDITRDMMNILGILHDNPDLNFSDILNDNVSDPSEDDDGFVDFDI